MYFDFHCHTKKTKKGESEERNVSIELFHEKIEQNGVRIVAITNHNHFDYKQYILLKDSVKEFCQVWPGIELDVKTFSQQPGHVIVICDPCYVSDFNDVVCKLIGNYSPDDFYCSIEKMCSSFSHFSPVYIPHYFKEPKLNSDDIELLKSNMFKTSRLLYEASNLAGLTVLNENGFRGLIGSDVINWKDYSNKNLPNLKFDIANYQSFIQLLDKDKIFINDLISRIKSEEIEVFGKFDKKENPFKIHVYDDVNIVFGDKGSGKSELIKSLENFYLKRRSKSVAYYKGGSGMQFIHDHINVDKTTLTVEMLGGKDLSNEFNTISNFSDKVPINPNEFFAYYESNKTNKNKATMKVLTIKEISDSKDYQLDNLSKEFISIKTFNDFFAKSSLNNGSKESKDMFNLLDFYFKESYKKFKEQFVSFKKNELVNFTLINLKEIVKQTTGELSVPGKIGLFEYVSNRLKAMRAIKKINYALIPSPDSLEPSLGYIPDKGRIQIRTKKGFVSSKTISEIDYRIMVSAKKDIVPVVNKIADIVSKLTLSGDVWDKINELKVQFETLKISNLLKFGYMEKCTALNGVEYGLSSGEMAILNIQNVLGEKDKDAYLLDEPETNLGSLFINKSIVPMISKLALEKKKIIIATHDSNIAIRTRPANSILKLTSNNIYSTYEGNMFSGSLINIDNSTDLKSWADESEKYLEGGSQAYIERGDIYGIKYAE